MLVAFVLLDSDTVDYVIWTCRLYISDEFAPACCPRSYNVNHHKRHW